MASRAYSAIARGKHSARTVRARLRERHSRSGWCDLEQLTRLDSGDVIYKLKRPWGPHRLTQLNMTGPAFIKRLAALIPPPYLNMTRPEIGPLPSNGPHASVLRTTSAPSLPTPSIASRSAPTSTENDGDQKQSSTSTSTTLASPRKRLPTRNRTHTQTTMTLPIIPIVSLGPSCSSAPSTSTLSDAKAAATRPSKLSPTLLS